MRKCLVYRRFSAGFQALPRSAALGYIYPRIDCRSVVASALLDAHSRPPVMTGSATSRRIVSRLPSSGVLSVYLGRLRYRRFSVSASLLDALPMTSDAMILLPRSRTPRSLKMTPPSRGHQLILLRRFAAMIISPGRESPLRQGVAGGAGECRGHWRKA